MVQISFAPSPVTTFEPERVAVLLMAGGTGTRLWPLSHAQRPKQFLPWKNGKSLLQETYGRVPAYVSPDHIFVNVAQGLEHWVYEQLPALPRENIIVIPEDRDTFPALGYAAAWIEARVPRATLVMLATDNHVDDVGALQRSLRVAIEASQSGANLVSIGIKPTHANPMYGYMRRGAATPFGASAVYGAGYVEKPSAQRAQELMDQGDHDWNAGMFVWDAATFFDACAKHAPAHARAFAPMRSGLRSATAQQRAALFAAMPAIAVDHGLLEKVGPHEDTFNQVFVRGAFGWDDVGNFTAFGRYLSHDASGNACEGNVKADTSKHCVLVCQAPYTLSVEGLSHTVVAISDRGEVLVCDDSRIGEVRSLTNHTIEPCLDARHSGHHADLQGNAVFGPVKIVDSHDCTVVSDNTVALVGIKRLHIRQTGSHFHVAPQSPRHKIASQAAPSTQVVVMDSAASLAHRVAADLVQDLRDILAQRLYPNIILSAGGTPLGVYAALRASFGQALPWRRITLYQMDEYHGLQDNDPRSFSAFLRDQLAAPLGMRSHLLTSVSDMQVQEDHLRAMGGIDLVLHGIGTNGHLGFNEPGSRFDSDSGIVELAQSTRAPLLQTFGANAPRRGLTLGLGFLNTARRVRIMATGPSKKEAAAKGLLCAPSHSSPLSSLQGHNDIRYYFDVAACSWLGGRDAL